MHTVISNTGLASEPRCPGFYSRHSKVSITGNFHVAAANQLCCCLEENGQQRLNDADRTHLVLGCRKLVLRKIFSPFSSLEILGFPTYSNIRAREQLVMMQ